jgi:hypothetical protein
MLQKAIIEATQAAGATKRTTLGAMLGVEKGQSLSTSGKDQEGGQGAMSMSSSASPSSSGTRKKLQLAAAVKTPAEGLEGAMNGRRFDTVVDTFGLCSFEDPVAALVAMQKVCKPGTGKVLLLEHGRSSWCTWLNDLVLDERAAEHAADWGCVWNRDIEGIVAKAGLEVVERSTYHFGTTYYIVAKPGPLIPTTAASTAAVETACGQTNPPFHDFPTKAIQHEPLAALNPAVITEGHAAGAVKSMEDLRLSAAPAATTTLGSAASSLASEVTKAAKRAAVSLLLPACGCQYCARRHAP